MMLSKRKVYVDSPQEAPEGAELQEGPRGGLYYEQPQGTGESEDGANIGERIQETFDISWVHLEGLGDVEKQTIMDALKELDKKGLSPSLIGLHAEEKTIGRKETMAAYSMTKNDIYINPKHYRSYKWEQTKDLMEKEGLESPDELYEWFNNQEWETLGPGKDKPEDAAEVGHMSDLHAHGTIYHEAAHAHHLGWIEDKTEEEADELYYSYKEFDYDEDKDVAWRVSEYATTDPMEFVAETFTGLMLGIEFDDEVMEMYDYYGGPEVPT